MEQNILKNAALKSTKKRQLLLFLLQKQARPMTAEELHELAEPILPMNTSTVYRTLNTLTEKEILIRSVRQDGKAYYALAKKRPFASSGLRPLRQGHPCGYLPAQ